MIRLQQCIIVYVEQRRPGLANILPYTITGTYPIVLDYRSGKDLTSWSHDSPASALRFLCRNVLAITPYAFRFKICDDVQDKGGG